MQDSSAGVLPSDAPEVEIGRAFPLNQDCLHYLWSFLPDEDLVRCERVCKAWQQSIKLWIKSALQSRFGSYRFSDILWEDDHTTSSEEEDAASNCVNQRTRIFQRFKRIAQEQKAVREHAPICTYIFPRAEHMDSSRNYAVWTNDARGTIMWARLGGETGVVAPEGQEILLENLGLPWASDLFPSLRLLGVNKDGIMLVVAIQSVQARDSPRRASLLYSLPHQITLAVTSDGLILGEGYRGFFAPMLLKDGQYDWSFIDLESTIRLSIELGRPCGQFNRVKKEHIENRGVDPFSMRDGTFIFTANSGRQKQYKPAEWREFGIIDQNCHLSTCQFSTVQGIFPARLRDGPFVHGTGGINLFATETIIRSSEDDRSEYCIFELWHKSWLQKPVRVLVRILQIKWPRELRIRGAAFLQHEFFSLLTVIEDGPERAIRLCDLKKLDMPPTEVLAQLESQDSIAVDEYYECDISEIVDVKPNLNRTTSEFSGEGLLQVRRWRRHEMSSDWRLLRFSC